MYSQCLTILPLDDFDDRCNEVGRWRFGLEDCVKIWCGLGYVATIGDRASDKVLLRKKIVPGLVREAELTLGEEEKVGQLVTIHAVILKEESTTVIGDRATDFRNNWEERVTLKEESMTVIGDRATDFRNNWEERVTKKDWGLFTKLPQSWDLPPPPPHPLPWGLCGALSRLRSA